METLSDPLRTPTRNAKILPASSCGAREDGQWHVTIESYAEDEQMYCGDSLNSTTAASWRLFGRAAGPLPPSMKVIICGSGLAGLGAAIALRCPGREIVVLEQGRLNQEM
jgi:hypothetical protein